MKNNYYYTCHCDRERVDVCSDCALRKFIVGIRSDMEKNFGDLGLKKFRLYITDYSDEVKCE